jgi:hypothetical protein
VRRAHQADVVDSRAASEAEGVPVVVLEVVTLGASAALRIGESTLTPVTAINGTTHVGRDVPR